MRAEELEAAHIPTDVFVIDAATRTRAKPASVPVVS